MEKNIDISFIMRLLIF